MRKTTRRNLLKTSGTTAVAFGLGTGLGTGLAADTKVPSEKNSALRLAVIGVGGRGKQHIKVFSECTGVSLVAFCDVDQDHVNNTAEEFEKTSGTKVARFNDYRELLASDDIDAVTIATPNHWHSLMAIHAMQAGKHVYVEKPVCHTLWEGRQMLHAQKQTDVVCAAGFQNRSVKGIVEAMSIIHSGKFGAIKQVRGLCYRNRKSIGKSEQPITPPASVNYDLWLGPAAELPIKRPNLHYDWHWDFNTGNGDMGNQGPHEMDLVQYALGDLMRHPKTIQSFGGRFAWDDGGNTPNMQCALFDYGNGIPVIFEVRNLYQKSKAEKFVGAYGQQSMPNIIVTMDSGEYRGGRFGGRITDSDGKVVHRFEGGDDHYQNFVDAARNNDPSSIRSTLETAFYSSCMSHLANIALLSGTAANDEQVAKALGDNALTKECFDRFCDQLDLWEVDRSETPWQLGSSLTFDSSIEQFTAGENFAAANQLLRRKDRAPYQVPELTP
jgi:predicted dehydrogenase